MNNWSTIIAILGNLAWVVGAAKFITDQLATWIGEDPEKRLHSSLKGLQSSLDKTPPETWHSIPLVRLVRVYDRVFGPRSFSRQSFYRASKLGLALLAACLGIAGLICGKFLALDAPPWESYSISISFLEYFSTHASAAHLRELGDPYHQLQNASDLAKLGTWPMAALFTVYFALLVITLFGCLFSVSVSVSRLFLHEMRDGRTTFRFFVIWIASTFVLLVLAVIGCVLLFVLSNVWTWPFLPLLFGLSKISALLGGGIATAITAGAWTFSGTWFKIIVFLSLLPSIFVAVVGFFGGLYFPLRRYVHSFGKLLLFKGLNNKKGLFAFLVALAGASVLLSKIFSELSSYLGHLSAKLNVASFFGIDALTFAFLLLIVLLLAILTHIGRHRGADPSAPGYQEILYIFVATFTCILTGYYLQAFVECYVNPQSVTPPTSASMALPAASALVPGLVSSYLLARMRMKGGGWLGAAWRVFIVLSAFDIFWTVSGVGLFRDCPIALSPRREATWSVSPN